MEDGQWGRGIMRGIGTKNWEQAIAETLLSYFKHSH